jgi:hypothetical protein
MAARSPQPHAVGLLFSAGRMQEGLGQQLGHWLHPQTPDAACSAVAMVRDRGACTAEYHSTHVPDRFGAALAP